MMKHFLASGSLLVALTVSGLPVRAQNSPPAPVPAPAAPAPTAAGVSQPELIKFAGAFKKILVIFQDMESQMVQAVQKEGLTEKRFSEILAAKKNPSAKPATQITPKEEQSYTQAISRLTQIQAEAQGRMDKAVESEGMAVDRFNQIFALVQKDPNLQQAVRQLIQK